MGFAKFIDLHIPSFGFFFFFFTEWAELCLISSGLILGNCREVLPHEGFVSEDNLGKKMSHGVT